MYKPGNVSVAPALVAPHQPRLDWQLWFAALGPHQSSPWFSALVLRLLQGQPDVIRLLQTDESRYPFHARPPTFLRAQLYKHRFTARARGARRGGGGSSCTSSSRPCPWDTPRWRGCSASTASRTIPRSLPALCRLCRGSCRGCAACAGPSRAPSCSGPSTWGSPPGSRERGERNGPRGSEGAMRGSEGARPEGARPEARHGSRRKK
ncbi:PREDICTED: lipase maturation factor 2 [Pseudopodoces humilis]|uniref:lipase maturation factor 2 n=1 Tax=Pseudopodoces humilis TaxID=181119 RepID=UPI0006B72732|nr:PREDICTED: lipase maturation factor 2 [Pseudopodoces humilis]